VDLFAAALRADKIINRAGAEDQLLERLTTVIALKFKDWHVSSSKIYTSHHIMTEIA
jgi:hypothetical protein